MSLIERAAPIRRSPLSAWHSRRGARMVSAGEWPATYGDVRMERDAARERVALLDAGPFDRLALTAGGVGAPPAPPYAVGRITDGQVDGRAAQLWALTSESSLLVAPAAGPRSAAALAAAVAPDGLRPTDVSSYYATLVLCGPRARSVLEEVFPVDLEGVGPREIAFGPLARVTSILARIDVDAVPSYTIMVERDQAEYVWESVLRIGERHGIAPVGAAALAED